MDSLGGTREAGRDQLDSLRGTREAGKDSLDSLRGTWEAGKARKAPGRHQGGRKMGIWPGMPRTVGLCSGLQTQALN